MDTDDWKAKYQQLAKDFRALEKSSESLVSESAQRRLLLEQVVRQLALELQGNEQVLDGRLEDLFTAMKSDKLSSLKRAASKLDRALRKTQSRRHKTGEEILLSVRRWISELRALANEDMTRNALEVIRNRSETAVSNYYDLPSLLSNMVLLQSEILDHLVDGDVSLSRPAVVHDEDMQLMLRHIAADILELIDGLQMPPEHHWECKQVMQKLERGFALPELPMLMQSTVKLVAICQRTMSDEFESYLLDVGSKITEMNLFLQSSFEIQKQGGSQQLQASEEVARQVDSIRYASESAAGLNDLKSLITQGLQQVQSRVAVLKQNEEMRQKVSETQHHKLSQKLKVVEEEARQTMVRVEEERMRSRIDPLTQLANRTGYTEKMGRELAFFAKSSEPLVLAVCDVDHFKRVNDQFGHLAGDKALSLIARVLRDSLRKTDFVARYGGEEFVIILPSTPCRVAVRLLEEIRRAISSTPFNFKGTAVPMTVSFGVTEYRKGENADQLFDRADQLLYQAKREGRNKLCFDELSETLD